MRLETASPCLAFASSCWSTPHEWVSGETVLKNLCTPEMRRDEDEDENGDEDEDKDNDDGGDDGDDDDNDDYWLI